MVIQLGSRFEVGVDHLSNSRCAVCRFAVIRDVSFLGGGLIYVGSRYCEGWRTWEFLKQCLFTLPLKPCKEEIALGGFSGSVEAFDGDEGSAGRGSGGGHCGCYNKPIAS